MAVTFMIIDDDSDDREIFGEALRQIDPALQLVACESGEEAFALLMKGAVKPDFVFLDMNMPGMNGRQCLIKFRAHAEFLELPVIIYTTSNRIEDAAEVKRIGAAAFLTKPTSMEVLKQAIALTLQRKWEKIQPYYSTVSRA
jgi:CheY-like chemotaxis protein